MRYTNPRLLYYFAITPVKVSLRIVLPSTRCQQSASHREQRVGAVDTECRGTVYGTSNSEYTI